MFFDGTYAFLPKLVYKRKTIYGLIRFVIELLIQEPIWYKNLLKELKGNTNSFIHCHFGPMGVLFSKFIEKRKIQVKYAVSFYGYDATSLPKQSKEYRNSLEKMWITSTIFFAEGEEMKQKIAS